MWALAHGRLGLMLHADALLPALLLLALWAWLAHLGAVSGRWRLPLPSSRVLWVLTTLGLVVFTVLRNLPWLHALAPPAAA